LLLFLLIIRGGFLLVFLTLSLSAED